MSDSDSTATDEATGDAPLRPARARRRSGPLLLGVGLGLLVVVAAVLGYAFLSRDTAPRLTMEAYEAALARWQKNGPADYDLDLELSGNRPGKIHVEVRGGEVVHMTRDGVEPKQKRTWDYWSVPGQFDTIETELENSLEAAKKFNRADAQMVMWAEFDPVLGYPRRYDRVVLGGDFEVHWKVTRFAVSDAKK